MNLYEAIANCVRDKGWPDYKEREETKVQWDQIEKMLTAPIKPEVYITSCGPEEHYIKTEYNKIYDTKKSTDGYIISNYITDDIEMTKNMYEMFKEREENNMNNGFKERPAHAVFFNKYYHRYDRIYIEKVIFNDPATIVMWNDHVKTVVKCQDGDIFDPEKGLAMAITKRFFGNQGNYCNELKKWLPEEEETINFDIDLAPLGEAAERMGGNISKAVSRIIGKCEDCKYENVLGYKWPCVKCVSASKWKPKKGE